MSPSEWRAEVFDPAELDAADLYDDASAKTALYARLSRRAAEAGDVVIAVAAAWAADVHAVQALWWERARDAGGGPFEPFLAAGAAISTGVPDGVVPPAGVAGRDDPRTAGATIEVARRGLLAAFDPQAALLVASRLAAVDHLSALPAPSALDARSSSPVQPFATQAADRTVGQLLDELWTVAVDARVIARALESAGYGRDALAQLVLAETANFEAYLLRVAEAVGDTDLLGADLRRAAFADLLPPLHELPQELGPARLAVRDVMRTVLGAGELGRFARLLEAYDSAEVVVELPERLLRPIVVPDVVAAPPAAAPVLLAEPPVVPAPEPVLVPAPAPEPVLVAAQLMAGQFMAPVPAEPAVAASVAVAPPLLTVVPAQTNRVPAPAAAYLPNPVRVPAPARHAGPVPPLGTVPVRAAEKAERPADELPEYEVPSGPPGPLPPPRELRDIFAQDLNGQGPRVGTLAPRPSHQA